MKLGTTMSDEELSHYLLNPPIDQNRPKPRAGWDDCEITDAAWDRLMEVLRIKRMRAQTT